jgi:hypothetical protein
MLPVSPTSSSVMTLPPALIELFLLCPASSLAPMVFTRMSPSSKKTCSSRLYIAWIKTQLGISNASYSHTDANPVFGTGQGSSSSPSIWTLSCSTGFDIYDSHCYGAQYRSPDGTKVLKLGMTGFVDDNNARFVDDNNAQTTFREYGTSIKRKI